jgi:hypothetical protein
MGWRVVARQIAECNGCTCSGDCYAAPCSLPVRAGRSIHERCLGDRRLRKEAYYGLALKKAWAKPCGVIARSAALLSFKCVRCFGSFGFAHPRPFIREPNRLVSLAGLTLTSFVGLLK